MAISATARAVPHGSVPLVNCEGTAAEAGEQLGYHWAEFFRLRAVQYAEGSRPWWRDKRYEPLLDRYAPHLVDVYRGIARGAGVAEDLVATRAPADSDGCTSFALAPNVTLDGDVISGQTKDTPYSRAFQFQVLRMKLSDAPSHLTLTYPGWLWGHGFVDGGCALFRNAVYGGSPDQGLPYTIWGMLALHCKTVEEVVEMTEREGVGVGVHCSIVDSHGGIRGLEASQGGIRWLQSNDGVYAHANCLVSCEEWHEYDRGSLEAAGFGRENSLHREARMRAQLEPERGRLTAQLAMLALTDHEGYPASVCRHESLRAMTCSAVVVEPNKGLLHCTRGNPCQNWPTTYAL